ncbi:AbrB/MazE/SpoVT family DNA-binding domain-containing protein [Candidatus Woesearchaeota archaeon]|nr:AbrB/MazE/SpoVT family DNA-binding domain-containing protein [Candidatus Woesearchaeota archaeon]
MKVYPKILQCDERGQVVIPKKIRDELNIKEGTGFFGYIIENEGIFLKVIPYKELKDNSKALDEIKKKAKKLGINPENIDKSIKKYQRKEEMKKV